MNTIWWEYINHYKLTWVWFLVINFTLNPFGWVSINSGFLSLVRRDSSKNVSKEQCTSSPSCSRLRMSSYFYFILSSNCLCYYCLDTLFISFLFLKYSWTLRLLSFLAAYICPLRVFFWTISFYLISLILLSFFSRSCFAEEWISLFLSMKLVLKSFIFSMWVCFLRAFFVFIS